MRRGFTLIEVLVVVAIIALLAAILLPSLASAREAGRSSACLANMHQVFVACRMYADANRGASPAIGIPYAALPNWALQIQAYCSKYRVASNSLYTPQSVLVCPTIRAAYAMNMQRTYAINATGHAGLPADPSGAWPADPDNYDAGPVHIRLDRVAQPARAAFFIDSARTITATNAPPSARTASMIDFRQEAQVTERLGRFHRAGKAFNTAMLDGSGQTFRNLPTFWKKPLP
jgi:prepilin-type N-terminal cleavage/methylation domain-containing protein